MRTSFFAATLAAVTGVSGVAIPQEVPGGDLAPSLPLDVFHNTPKKMIPVPLAVAAAKFKNATGQELPEVVDIVGEVKSIIQTRATCASVKTRVEWDSYGNTNKQAYLSAIKCLMGKPRASKYTNAKSRYEDIVALHQSLTPNVHGNSKFLVWHRYFTWTFESILKTECGFTGSIPWFDETKYAGRFKQSSIYSSQWYGSQNSGQCVGDGQFARLTCNVGPGTSNGAHCLQRDINEDSTAQVTQAYVNQCNAWGDYASMASCSEGGPHAWGHNAVGGIMADMYASPSDPVFWLHHGFIDRNFRIWQNGNSARLTSINGNDYAGNPLSLSTTISVQGFRPDTTIGAVMDTTGTTLCYKYNY